MRLTLAATAAVLVGLAALPSPAPAQISDKVLIIYGEDKCPTSGGEEIVICARKPESERYRIPEELRESVRNVQQSWSNRASSIEYVGRSGTNSCSPSGAGGATGCHAQLIRQARAERAQAAANEPDLD